MIEINDFLARYPSGRSIQVEHLVIPNSGSTLIVGENGSGKSTLIRSILHLHDGFQGSIRIDGQDNRSFSRLEMARHISYLPQNSAQIPDMPAEDFIRQGFYALQKGDFEAVIETLGIEHFLNRRLSALSGGEYQLCRLARALVAQTPYALLDEPDSFLSQKNKKRFFETIEALGMNRSLVLVSHSEHDFHRFKKILKMEYLD